ncbi:hypothetical protein QYM36_012234 [Artemia franciscana]|uniref:MIF4G domain-containing protein n=1 Tax=Artemia franciscana TaxID=6661 RepID=A0AA88HFA9_ARTSF|nr:hypothetical protein QYM36_012234 [Artemia franciscana]
MDSSIRNQPTADGTSIVREILASEKTLECRFNGDKEEVPSTIIGELRHIRQQMYSQVRKMDEFLEKTESDKQQRLKAACAEQQTTEIRLQNALTELEITRAEMIKVQRESVRKLPLESSKHTKEISTFEKENAATAHALEQIQTGARLLKSSLESSLSKNESALVQLGKTKGQLEQALDRENSLKLELKESQNQLSVMVKKKDEDSYKHAKDISSLEERNAATVHALEEALCRENALKIELEKLQNELCAVTDEKDKKEHSQVPVQDVTLPSYVAEKEETIEVAEVSTSQVFNSKILSNPVLPVEPIADLTVPTAVVFPAAILQIRPQFPRYANQSSPFVQPRFSHSKNPAQYFTPFPHTNGKVPLQVLPATQKPIPQNRETMLHAIVDPNTNEEVPPPVLETSAAAPEESIPIPQNTKREPDLEEGKESNFPAHSPPESPLPEIEQYENLSVKLIYPYKEGQWSPLNPGGTKKYDREFLKMIQGSPLAKITPNIRAEISSTGQAFKQPASWNQGRKQTNQGHFDTAGADTMSPAYLRSSMQGNRAPLPQRSSQGKGMHRPTTMINIPVAQSKAAFPKVENARVPDTFAKKKVTDKEEQKTIDLKKSVRRNLNKLTPENYDKISKNILHMEVDTEERLSALVQIFFDKAVGDPIYAPICSNIYAQIYAELCKLMFEKEVPSASGTGKVSFRKLLLDRCQQTFEKEKKDEEEIVSKQKALEEADTEEKKKELQMELNERIAKTKRIMLGNIRFIGELFKLRMLTIKIMNFCISKLLKSRDEEQLECLCKLISTIGKTYEEEYDAKFRRAVAESKSSGKQMQFQLTKLDVYLNEMRKLSQSEVLSFPIRSMLMDVLNLKQNRWVPYREGEKPKTKKNTKKKTKEKERLEKEGRGDDQSSYRPPPKMTSQPREMKLGPTKAWSKGAGLTPTAVQTGGGRYSALLDDEGSSVSSPSVTNIRLGPPRSMGHRGAATESMGPVPTERQKAVQASRSFTRSRSQQASRESSLSRQGAATPTTEQVPFQAKSELKGKPDLTEEGNETKILPAFVLRGCMQLLFGVIVQ